MPAFASTPAPVHTLWDTPDMATQRLPGVWWVKTPSHGGFVLSDERQAAMPEALRLDSIYYEEDVNWTLVTAPAPSRPPPIAPHPSCTTSGWDVTTTSRTRPASSTPR